MRRPRPIKAWREMGEWDAASLDDYRPGAWAPLDLPIGLQAMTVFIVGMSLVIAGAIAWFVFEAVS